MSEIKKCIKYLALYFLLFGSCFYLNVADITYRFPASDTVSLYLQILSVCLILRYNMIVAGKSKLKSCMLALSHMILLMMMLRGIKYSVFSCVSDLGRYTWYLYYLPILCIPMLLFYVSLYVYTKDEQQVKRRWGWVMIVTAVLVAVVLTNDLHQQVFCFQQGFLNWDSDYSYGPGDMIVTAWEYGLYTASVFILVTKYPISKNKRWSWLIFVPFSVGLAFILLQITGNMIQLNGHEIVEFPEAFCFMAAGVIECCIQLGLIPTNESYRELMKITSVPVQITDRERNVIFKSDVAKELTKEQFAAPDKTRIDEHTILRRMEIPGGYGFFENDVTKLDRLNEELAEAKVRLAEETELTRLQIELEEKQAKIEQRSLVYDKIAKRTQTQSQMISMLADEAYEATDPVLIEQNRKKIVLLAAYIKRYANLMLLSADSSVIEAGELALSLSEPLRYLNSFGTPVEILNRSEGILTAESTFAVFEAFQALLESNQFSLLGVSVNLSNKNDGISCRLTLEGLREGLSEAEKTKLNLAGVKTDTRSEDGIVYLTFLLPEGGETTK